jgi:hypothetical protein
VSHDNGVDEGDFDPDLYSDDADVAVEEEENGPSDEQIEDMMIEADIERQDCEIRGEPYP